MKRLVIFAASFCFCLLFALLSLFARSPLSSAQQNRGVSWLGQMCHAKADCKVIYRAYDDLPVVNAGWLVSTFNATGCKCSSGLLKDPRLKRVRVSICNSTCFPERGRRCQRHECFAAMNARQASRAILKLDPATFRRIDAAISIAKTDLLGAVGPLEAFVKPCLECTLSHPARALLNAYVAAQFGPQVRIVDNPINDRCSADLVCERHGAALGDANTIVDTDGTDYGRLNKAAFWRGNQSALMALAWKPCANGYLPGRFVPPLSRSRFCTLSDAVNFNRDLRRKYVEPAS
jgi:hypothetical protein